MYIYNTTTQEYFDIEDYLTNLENTTGSVYHILFLYTLDSIFEKAQKLSALRARNAKDDNGKSLLDQMAITVDEQAFFDDRMPIGAQEVFRKISAWSKGIDRAYRYNIKFGTVQYSGNVDSVASPVLTDSSQSFTVDDLIGKKLVITSGACSGEEKTITDNDATTITYDTAFSGDITGADYSIFNQTDDYIYMAVQVSLYWDLNMLPGLDKLIEQALTSYIIKEWYLMNRYQDDYLIESSNYERLLSEIRSQLFQRTKPGRSTGFWKDN